MNRTQRSPTHNRNQASAHWSLWLLLVGLFAVSAHAALPSLQHSQPGADVGPASALSDEWNQQHWLLSSRDSRAGLRQHFVDPYADEPSLPGTAAGPSTDVPLPVLSSVAVAIPAVIHTIVLPVTTLPGAPRGPPALLA